VSLYYSDEHVNLYHGDWRELIPADLTVDLIAADPPYGETSLDWDTWPIGWPTLAARHARSMWCFGSMRMFLRQRDEFAAWKLSQDVVWEKNKGTIFTSDRFSRVHEHALHWYRESWADVHHETPRVLSTGKRVARAIAHGKSRHTGVLAPGSWEDDGTRLQPSVIYSPNMHRRGINETEKPIGILEPLIAYGCPLGGSVLDPFAGSSSTLVAARNTGRKAIGYEKRESQCEAAALRLSQGVLDFGGVA